MYRILIVDDEKRERDGLEKLIRKYRYPLEILQASDGEEALELFKKQRIEILLTDIKMPFMTGIELIEEVRKRGYMPFCIIFSAYGEFEYAQNAIALGVIQYLLKPISMDDFQKLFEKVLKLCEERTMHDSEIREREQEREIQRLQESYHLLLAILEGKKQSESNVEAKLTESLFYGRKYRMILLSSFSFLLTAHWKSLEEDLQKIAGTASHIINLDDMQILICLETEGNEGDRYAGQFCENIIRLCTDIYQINVFLSVSPVCPDVSGMKKIYPRLKESMDYQFFVSESFYMFCDRQTVGKKEGDILPIYFNNILTNVKLKNIEATKDGFEEMFRYMEENIGFSSIYIKYSLMDLMKQIFEETGQERETGTVIDRIFSALSLEMLREDILTFLDHMQMESGEKETENRLVNMTKKIIQEKYRDVSLGVSMIAEGLHVSLAYLSTLFKMETGQTLNKYITYYRMEKARLLLETTNRKIAEISQDVGYMSTSYFISLFRAKEGCSPQQYRERVYNESQT